ncbi:MAG: nitrogenase component 1 [Lachnospiraceae bacterium]|nr:nitrogenase component 1 [Lachnospiraceae bacterium]
MIKAVYYTAKDIAESGIPDEFRTGKGLVYSSPATLAYNSPGAEGFGVKRAALAVPETIELVISPRCCGRNSAGVPGGKDVDGRLFFMEINEIDLVTGRYLKRIPEEAEKAVKASAVEPKAIVLVSTCVDALLGTDMDHIALKCEEKTGVRTVHAPMYALTREGLNPPMVQVRRSIYSLLEERKKDPHAANVLGYFGGLDSDSMEEMREVLRPLGITKLRTAADCRTYEEFQEMAEASLNIVLDPEARAAADDISRRLGTGYIELQRFYGEDRIKSQYKALYKAFGLESDFVKKIPAISRDYTVSVGECANARPAELALSLIEYGARVKEVFCTLSDTDIWYIQEIAKRSPSTRFYFNQHPSMVGHEPDPTVNLCIGKDAAWYYRDTEAKKLDFNADSQPFGYSAVKKLIEEIDGDAVQQAPLEVKHDMRYASDQSGAVSVIFPMDSLTVIIDAGGCTGNVCGFDEPRWQNEKAMIFSAGLRDMDAILGRDEELIRKIVDAAKLLSPSFITLIGTPVPSTIGTDYNGLKRQLEKQTGLPVVAVPANGMESYENGIEKAKEALEETFGKRLL